MDRQNNTSERVSSGRALPPMPAADGSPGGYDPCPAQLLINKHSDLRYPYYCEFGNATLEIAEGVFCPTLTNASPLLLEAVTFRPGQRVLDVFAGSGAFAINAALSGAYAVAVDISGCAVSCARRNAVLNHVKRHVEVRLGTMDTCVAHAERFDVIVANPPLLPSEGVDMAGYLATAIYDPGLQATIAFIEGVRHLLSADGHAYLVTSDVLSRYCHDVDRLAFENDLECSLVAKRDAGYETYRVHELTRRCSDPMASHDHPSAEAEPRS